MNQNENNRRSVSDMEVFGEKELQARLQNVDAPEHEDTPIDPEEAEAADAYDAEAERREKNEQLRINFDHLAAYEPHTWSHNARYLPELLKRINPLVGGTAVDVFCQRGELVRTLSPQFSKVIGIDLSPKMIEVAKEKSEGYDNVTYVCGDFMEYELPENSCGLITMVAALHHLPTAEAIAKAKRCLKRAGRLIIVDLYRPATIGDLIATTVAGPLNTIGAALFDKHKADAEEMSHWRVHRSLDWYDTIPEIKRLAGAELPGARIRRRLFWRYTLEWVKP